MPAFQLLQLFFLDTKEDVLAIRARAKALVLEGKTLMEATGSNGKASRKQFTLPADQIIFECNAALKHLDPATYGRRRRTTYSVVTNRGDIY